MSSARPLRHVPGPESSGLRSPGHRRRDSAIARTCVVRFATRRLTLPVDPPRTRRAGHVRLAAEASLDAHLAGDGCHLIREDREGLVMLLMASASAATSPLGAGEILLQVAVGHCGHYFLADAADLFSPVGRHDVGEVSVGVGPHYGNARHLRLTAKFAFGSDLATRVTSEHEPVELIHHGVDGVLEFGESRSSTVILRRQAPAPRPWFSFRNIANLSREVRCRQIHVVGEIFPCSAANTRHNRSASETSVCAHFARNARHAPRKSATADHRVERPSTAEFRRARGP